MRFFDNIKHNLQLQNRLTILIAINVAIFLIANLSQNLTSLNLVPYLGLPAELNEFVYKVWTLFTYMFTHTSLMHILYNLLLLYFSGQIFYSILGEKRLLYVYIISGLAGGLIFNLMGMLAPDLMTGNYLIGASAAIMGVVAVSAIYAPNLEVNLYFIITMPYKYFAILVFVLSTLIDFAVNTGGKISHIGGALFGLFYGLALKKGNDWMKFSFMGNRSKNLKIIHKNHQTSAKSTSSDEAYLNLLLDKISKSGYDSLTKKEKEDLFRFSQKK